MEGFTGLVHAGAASSLGQTAELAQGGHHHGVGAIPILKMIRLASREQSEVS